MSLRQPRAVVTGAGSGLGRAFAIQIAKRGGRVVVSDVQEDGARETVEAVEAAGGQAKMVLCDVAQQDQVAALEEAATHWYGNTDLLINNAGVAVAGSFEKTSLDDWRWIVGINLWGVVYGCHTFLPAMKRRNEGFIINVASIAGLLAPPSMSPYNVTKSSVVALSESLAAELRDTDVNVTVLCPSFFKTNILEAGRGDKRLNVVAEDLMRRSKVQAPDVAEAALDHVERGELYCVPMQDARSMWRLKRASPERYISLIAQIQKPSIIKNRWIQRVFGLK